MRARSVAVAMACLLAASASAQEPPAGALARAPQRGVRSVLGLSFLGLGVGGVGLGLGALLVHLDSAATLSLYVNGSFPTEADARDVARLSARSSTSLALSLTGFIAGGLLVAAGVVLLVLDAPGPAVSVVPLPGGAAVALASRF